MSDDYILSRLRDALGTGEVGEALIEVARNAHAAERTLASMRVHAVGDIDDTHDGGPQPFTRFDGLEALAATVREAVTTLNDALMEIHKRDVQIEVGRSDMNGVPAVYCNMTLEL